MPNPAFILNDVTAILLSIRFMIKTPFSFNFSHNQSAALFAKHSVSRYTTLTLQMESGISVQWTIGRCSAALVFGPLLDVSVLQQERQLSILINSLGGDAVELQGSLFSISLPWRYQIPRLRHCDISEPATSNTVRCCHSTCPLVFFLLLVFDSCVFIASAFQSWRYGLVT